MSAVDAIKQRLDIVSVVGGSVALIRSGRNFKALCPFHQERTPSFYVFPDTQTWRCFGACGTGGDIFSFVMKREGIGFPDALRSLAAQAGVMLEEHERPQQEVREESRLREALQAAALFYHDLLLNSPRGANARAYAEQRGISPDSIRGFMLGYSPADWDALRNYLAGRGFTAEELLAAGLLTEGASGSHYDRFRDRLMFPIHDVEGRIVGFGARGLEKSAVPKYLNSPQTALFDKSATLYALNFARDAIRQKRQAVIVEGYMDALMAHQHGFKNVIASMGTSLTEKQVALLSRYTQNIVLALDPDEAGRSATLRGLELVPEALGDEDVAVPFWQGHVRRKQVAGRQVISRLPQGAPRIVARHRGEIKVLTLPPGKDPDELVREAPEQWQRLVDQSEPMIDFLLRQAQEQFDLSSPKGKAEAVEQVLPFVAELPSAVAQAHYLQRLATLVGVTEATLRAELPAPGRKRSRRSAGAEPEPARGTLQQHLEKLDVLEDYCLALLLRYDFLAGDASMLRPDHFLSPDGRELFLAWRTAALEGTDLAIDEVLLPRYEQVLEVALPPANESLVRAALRQCLHRLEERRLRDVKAHDRLRLAEAESELSANDIAVAAYRRWRRQSGAEAQVNAGEEEQDERILVDPGVTIVTEQELLVNRELDDLMKQRRLGFSRPSVQ